MYFCPISTILKAMALEQEASNRPENLHVVGKEASTLLVHCMESRIVLKTGQQEKLYLPTNVNVSQQCRPQLLSVKFENLVQHFKKRKLNSGN